jgi:hydrogenase/urease accessory protein HupE
MSFSLYFVGTLIVIGGVAWGMIKAGLPTVWVIIAAVIMLGVGILSAVSHTRSRDLPKDPS